MKKNVFLLWVIPMFLLVLVCPRFGLSQKRTGMTKWEYYNYLCQKAGVPNKLAKPTGFLDRKKALLDYGKIRTEVQNTNLMGYSRTVIAFEFPKGSNVHYNWCQGLVVGGKLNGEKRVSNSTLGTVGLVENHYEPLSGYDSGVFDNGIAMSSKPESWPGTWPADAAPLGSLGFPGVYEDGEVAATAEAFWVAVDDDPSCKQSTPLHIRTYGRALQWSSVIAEDFIVWKFFVENTGTDTITDCYVGVITEMDAPEEGENEWEDDFAVFIPVEEDSVLGNMLYLWDGDDHAEGVIAKGVAWQALKMLETPVGPDGKQIGLTTLATDTYTNFYGCTNQAQAYDWLSGGIDPIDNVTPHPMDLTNTPNTYGPDIMSWHASGPFDLAPGDMVTFTFANIFGTNKQDLLANAALCQTVYDLNYKTANPPEMPRVTAVAGDQQVTLYWDADPSESSVDDFTGTNAFEGYKIYRSTDRGLSWGNPITNAYGVPVDYIPIAECDVINDIAGPSELDPHFNLGNDTGLFHKYTDKNLQNGVEYWYAVCAYDHNDLFEGTVPVPPMKNPQLSNAYYPDDNTVDVIPQAAQAGWSTSAVTDVTHTSGNSAGTVEVEVVDPNEVVSGTYRVTFTQSSPTMVNVALNGTTVMGPVEVTPYGSTNIDGMPVFNGMRLTAVNAPAGWDEDATGQTVGTGLDWCSWVFEYDEFTGSGLADDYEFRFTEGGSIAWQYSSPWGPMSIPFEVWNITTDMQINCDIYDRGDLTWDPENKDYIAQHNTPYDPDNYISSWPDDYNYWWRFCTNIEWNVGDVYRIVTHKPFSTSDVYEFTAAGAKVDAEKADLDKIRVVPNPYAITSSYQYSQTPWVKELQFHHLPEQCTIRIFTISGELVQILHHKPGSDGYRGPGVEAWNLWTYNKQEVAFGVYIYHVKAEGVGEKLGKFAIIK